jgi:hypothetical protein
MQNLIDRETRKVGKGGTENGPAILPIDNSFEFFFGKLWHVSNTFQIL